jgi:uncharacterized protein (DUF362 family)
MGSVIVDRNVHEACSSLAMKENHRRHCHRYRRSRRDFLGQFSAAAAGFIVGGLGGFAPVYGASPQRSSAVALTRLEGYAPYGLKNALQAMFSDLGGLSDIIKPGDHVGIKINLTGGHGSATSFSQQTGLHPGATYWTHPEVLRAVGELILDAGAGKVTIAEAVYDHESYHNWGYSDVGSHLGADFVDLNGTWPYGGYATRPVGDSWFIYDHLVQNGILNDFDCMVSLAKSKRHNGAGVTHGMKNLVGTLPIPSGLYNAGQGYRAAIHNHRSHDGNTSSNLCRVILDLNKATPIHLVVNDAIMTVLGGEGPWGPPLTPTSFDALICSKDPVAADVIATQAIGFDPEAPGESAPFPDGLNYLSLAGDLGMGASTLAEIDLIRSSGVGVDAEAPASGSASSLKAYPNPFQTSTTLEFYLDASASAQIDIYSITGKPVRSLGPVRAHAGRNRIDWDGRSNRGAIIPAGMYVVSLTALGSRLTSKIARIH